MLKHTQRSLFLLTFNKKASVPIDRLCNSVLLSEGVSGFNFTKYSLLFLLSRSDLARFSRGNKETHDRDERYV